MIGIFIHLQAAGKAASESQATVRQDVDIFKAAVPAKVELTIPMVGRSTKGCAICREAGGVVSDIPSSKL